MTDLDEGEVRRRCKELVDAMAPFLTFGLNPFDTMMLIKHLEFCLSLIGESQPPPSTAELIEIITAAVQGEPE
jgi:hypothetical protein